jgi:hypothetical protein
MRSSRNLGRSRPTRCNGFLARWTSHRNRHYSGIIAAIAIPNLLRAECAANESAAVVNVHTIAVSLATRRLILHAGAQNG